MSYIQGNIAAFQTLSGPMPVTPHNPSAQAMQPIFAQLHAFCTAGNGQTLANGAETILHFDATSLPNYAVTSQPSFTYVAATGIATCTVAGMYVICSQYTTAVGVNLASQPLIMQLYKNATVQAAVSVNYGAKPGSVHGCCIVNLAVGDTVKVGITQTSGGAIAVTDGNVGSTLLVALRVA